MKETLEELTKEKFERSIASVIRSCNEMANDAIRLFRETEFYECNGYRIKYYYNEKENEYSFTYAKKEIGFKPVYKKPNKESHQLTLF